MVEPENILALILVLLGDRLRLVGESIVENLIETHYQPNLTVNADVKIQLIPHFLSHVACETGLHVALLCHDSFLLVIIK